LGREIHQEENAMPKVSKDSAADVQEFPMGVDRSEDLDGYTVNFVEITQTHDLAPMLKGLPDDQCHCPHWGYVFKGKLTWRFGDREEVYEAGDAFYVPPGHTPEAEAGSEFVQFSPTDELRETEEAIARNMQAAQAG
jgi:mannose-6-phosphate isomerase-like protein (cupin superfamily)